MTIVLTTHYLDEADSMAGRVVVVDNGEVIADDTAEALKADLAGDRIEVASIPRRRPRRRASSPARRPVAGAREVTVDGLVTGAGGRRAARRCRSCSGPPTGPGIAVAAAQVAPADARRRVPHPDRPQPARG